MIKFLKKLFKKKISENHFCDFCFKKFDSASKIIEVDGVVIHANKVCIMGHINTMRIEKLKKRDLFHHDNGIHPTPLKKIQSLQIYSYKDFIRK